jgi:hypothetical protein
MILSTTVSSHNRAAYAHIFSQNEDTFSYNDTSDTISSPACAKQFSYQSQIGSATCKHRYKSNKLK